MTDARADYWCILRCSPSRTLALATALTEAGFDAWTPGSVVIERVGRRRERVQRTVPVTPTFVFADYGQVGELARLSTMPGLIHMVWDKAERRMVTKGRPHFTVFRHGNAYPSVADRALDPLRLVEQRRRPADKAPSLLPGALVKHPDSGFDGMVGEVVRMKGRHAVVLFPGLAIPVHVEPRHLIAC